MSNGEQVNKKSRAKKGLDFKSFLKKALKENAFKAEYERLRPEFEKIGRREK